MREAYGDLWAFHDRGFWIGVTTNGDVRKDGAAVMGRGVALQAKQKFPGIEYEVGARIRKLGNHVQPLVKYRIMTFPVKHHWFSLADLGLINRSCGELMSRIHNRNIRRIYLPRPGCGNGKLDWHDVRDAIFDLLDDRVIVITHAEE